MKKLCPFDPTIYKDSPMGMFHCPWCGEMQMAGMAHLPGQYIETDEEEYAELVENMKYLLKGLKND